MIKSVPRRSLYRAFSSLVTEANVITKEIYVPPHDKPLTNDIQRLEEFLRKSKRLFVLTGAGISTESGIPDYRSAGVGLYARTTQRPM